MRRIWITVAYDGGSYHGWQVQPGLPTIQGTLQAVLGTIEGAAVHVAGSGRTDAGVHAKGQVAAFDMSNPIPPANLKRALNRLLPADIRVLEAGETRPDFDPRRDAVAKHYLYRIWREEVCPPFERRWVHHHPYPLDETRMKGLARVFQGEHDFSAFAASDESDKLGRSKVRRIFFSHVQREDSLLTYRVHGSGFLKHMVRNLVGTLLEAGKGNLDEADLRRFLEPGATGKAGPTAPPEGLFLMRVEYS